MLVVIALAFACWAAVGIWILPKAREDFRQSRTDGRHLREAVAQLQQTEQLSRTAEALNLTAIPALLEGAEVLEGAGELREAQMHREEARALAQKASELQVASQRLRATIRAARDSRTGNVIEASLLIALGLCLSLVGLYLIRAVQPWSMVVTLIFGPAFLGAGFWCLRHWRQNWHDLAQGGHRLAVLAHISGIIVLPIIGILILVNGL